MGMYKTGRITFMKVLGYPKKNEITRIKHGKFQNKQNFNVFEKYSLPVNHMVKM